MPSSIFSTSSKGLATDNQPGQVSADSQSFGGNKAFTDGLKTNEIQANTTSSIVIKNSSGSVTTSVSETGNLSVLNNIQQNGSNIISWVEVTPTATEWSFSGPVSNSITINPSTIPTNARYLLADVFVTANLTDHFNISFGRSSISSVTNWISPRGSQPSSQFASGVGGRNVVTMTYHGDSDGFSPHFGQWWSSVFLPTNGRQLFYALAGVNNASTTGWLYVIVKAYSL